MLRAAEISYALLVLSAWATWFGRKLLPVVCLLAAQPSLRADGNSDWFARPWESYDGLPNNTVQGLAQTPDGYLWLGTPSGLVRFDGVRFDEIPSTNFVAPPNNGIVTMMTGRAGALWLAMDRGALVCLDAGDERRRQLLIGFGLKRVWLDREWRIRPSFLKADFSGDWRRFIGPEALSSVRAPESIST